MTWQRGRPAIERLLDSGELEQVEPAKNTTERLLTAAAAHLQFATKGIADDPEGAFQLGYDAARKSAAALLATQGLRSTTQGGHIAVQEAVLEQFGGTKGMPIFSRLSRLRRQRNAAEYPAPGSPTITAEDATACLETAQEILGAACGIIDSGRLDRWT